MPKFDVLIVGAGFSGLYMLHKVRQLGLSACILEKGDGVGGTWYWNRYPGARCDIESMSYSYSFSEELQQDWSWSHRYATQPEILRYANHVADRFDLRRDIRFGIHVTAARWSEQNLGWTVETTEAGTFEARWLVMATGCLSVPKVPDLPGLATFKGRVLHTADWPREGVDFTGHKVGLVGTGSSAIQSIPFIAKQAEHLTVFQRTPNFSIPAWNAPLPPETERDMKSRYGELRAKSRNSYVGDYADEGYVTLAALAPASRDAALEKCWKQGGFNMQYAFTDVMVSDEANALAAEFVRGKIRETVKDPQTAERLCPKDHPFGTKRLCVDSDYFETYNRPNVSLVDLRAAPITGFTADGLATKEATYGFDTLVLATGFDAMTGALTAIDVVGRDGLVLRDVWKDMPMAYLGLCVPGFPNMFTLTGPGSPSVFTNMMLAIEQHVDFVSGLLDHAAHNDITRIEASEAAQENWAKRVAEGAERTLFVKANSWYLGSNVPGKTRVFMPFAEGFCVFDRACRDVAENNYEGLDLRKAAA